MQGLKTANKNMVVSFSRFFSLYLALAHAVSVRAAVAKSHPCTYNAKGYHWDLRYSFIFSLTLIRDVYAISFLIVIICSQP